MSSSPSSTASTARSSPPAASSIAACVPGPVHEPSPTSIRSPLVTAASTAATCASVWASRSSSSVANRGASSVTAASTPLPSSTRQVSRQPLRPLEGRDRRPVRLRARRPAAGRVVADAALVEDDAGPAFSHASRRPARARDRAPSVRAARRRISATPPSPTSVIAEHHRRGGVEVGAQAEADAGEDPQRPGVVAGARGEVRDHDVVERERERQHRPGHDRGREPRQRDLAERRQRGRAEVHARLLAATSPSRRSGRGPPAARATR